MWVLRGWVRSHKIMETARVPSLPWCFSEPNILIRIGRRSTPPQSDLKPPDGADPARRFPPAKVDMPERLAGKKTIVVGLPGAFTPT